MVGCLMGYRYFWCPEELEQRLQWSQGGGLHEHASLRQLDGAQHVLQRPRRLHLQHTPSRHTHTRQTWCKSLRLTQILFNFLSNSSHSKCAGFVVLGVNLLVNLPVIVFRQTFTIYTFFNQEVIQFFKCFAWIKSKSSQKVECNLLGDLE